MSTVYLSLGLNQGDRRSTMERIVRRIGSFAAITGRSAWYQSVPVGVESGPMYLNAVVRCQTDLGPTQLLDAVKAVERWFGRSARRARWSPRPADIDILLYDNAIIETPRLTIPHPRLAQRLFVLIPLADLAADLKMPLSRRTVRDLLRAMSDPSQSVSRIAQRTHHPVSFRRTSP